MPCNTASVATRDQRLTPLAPERYALQVTVPQATHDKLRYAQTLLGHAVPSGDMAQVLDRALEALIARLEQRRFAECARSRPVRGARAPRAIPAAVRRDVWRRDGGRCTFVSAAGRRSESCTRLEFDHARPAACGGAASAANLRLRCRAHNQYAAERAFGAGFMREKREAAAAARGAAEAMRGRCEAGAAAPCEAIAADLHATEAHREAAAARRAVRPRPAPGDQEAPQSSAAPAPDPADITSDDVGQALRILGFRAEAVRRGLACTAHLAHSPLEQRLRAALSALAPRCVRSPAPGT